MLNALRHYHKDNYRCPTHYLALIIVLIMSALPITTHAHEFWIEPTHYQLDKGEPIVARLKVGQKLVGTPQVYLPKRFEAFDITTNDTTHAVTSRMGNDPAVNQAAETAGLHILSYVSKDSTVTYDDAATFTGFLKAEGIEWVLAEHEKRGLPDTGFTEAYQRFAKSLVQVGKENAEASTQGNNDRVLGLRFELIAESNPYTSEAALPIQLLWEGKPFADAQINVFRRHNNQLTTSYLRTDDDGRALLEHQPGDYLLNAVHMIDPTVPTNTKQSKNTDKSSNATEKAEQTIVWKSLWASLTFQIPDL